MDSGGPHSTNQAVHGQSCSAGISRESGNFLGGVDVSQPHREMCRVGIFFGGEMLGYFFIGWVNFLGLVNFSWGISTGMSGRGMSRSRAYFLWGDMQWGMFKGNCLGWMSGSQCKITGYPAIMI